MSKSAREASQPVPYEAATTRDGGILDAEDQPTVFSGTATIVAMPLTSQQDARSLADRIRSGDPAAEQELVERFSRGVKVILRNAGADASAVDDLHQETFRIALEKIRRGELRDAAGLSGFMASLARNLAIEHFRRPRPPSTNDPEELESVQSAELTALDRIIAGEQARRAPGARGAWHPARPRDPPPLLPFL
jgi:hypothetical protein